jgi:hypothetical protein
LKNPGSQPVLQRLTRAPKPDVVDDLSTLIYVVIQFTMSVVISANASDSEVPAMNSNMTSVVHTNVASHSAHDSVYKLHDVNVTSATNVQIDDNLSAANISRIVCFWVVFMVGVVGNLIVVILVVWKCNRKQVFFMFSQRTRIA